jgi:hypothetical protein
MLHNMPAGHDRVTAWPAAPAFRFSPVTSAVLHANGLGLDSADVRQEFSAVCKVAKLGNHTTEIMTESIGRNLGL